LNFGHSNGGRTPAAPRLRPKFDEGDPWEIAPDEGSPHLGRAERAYAQVAEIGDCDDPDCGRAEKLTNEQGRVFGADLPLSHQSGAGLKTAIGVV
jgi:hypothetical protein